MMTSSWRYYSTSGAISEASQAFVLQPSISQTLSAAPMLFDLDGPALTASVFHRDDFDTAIAVLSARSYNVEFRDELNEPGSGKFVLLNSDTLLADIIDGDLVRFDVYGVAAWAMLVRHLDRLSIAPNEEIDEATEVSGPGTLAIFDEACVYPARGVRQLPAEEDRIFSWPSVDYDDSWWRTATTIAVQGAGSIYWDGLPAEGWPNPNAQWIWASNGTQEWAPPGTCYFRHTFTADADGRMIVYLTCDDAAELYVDSQLMLSTSNGFAAPTEIRTVVLDITAGEHTIAVQATNTTDDPALPPHTHNPAGLLVSGYYVDTLGTVGSSLFVSDNTWLIVEYPPTPPGMTPGEVLMHCLDEAQARGALVGVNVHFDEDVDSAGVAWTEVTDIATRVGTDCLTFFREIAATYVDLWMAPASLDLYAWIKDTRGVSASTTLHPPADVTDPYTGNLRSLRHARDTSVTNSMLVRWSKGWEEVPRSDSISAHGRREALLALGAVQSEPELQRVTNAQLDIFAQSRTAITAEVTPEGAHDTPYVAFQVADELLTPGEDLMLSSERVIAISTKQDEHGTLTFVPELKDVRLFADERFAQTLKKMADGTLRGNATVATPVSSVLAQSAPNCCPPQPAKP